MIIPLMKPNEWEFLQSYLHKDQIMLEYGKKNYLKNKKNEY